MSRSPWWKNTRGEWYVVAQTVLFALVAFGPLSFPGLRPDVSGWSAADWQAFFDERAGIAEFDQGLPRPAAEARAREACIAQWLSLTHEATPPGRCAACGGPDRPHDPLLPHGTDATGHAWLHDRCWLAWQANQRRQAIAALAAMGIIPSPATPADRSS